MAQRPIFVPQDGTPRVRTVSVDFEWFPGFALAQQQRSIASLHAAAVRLGVQAPLEISSKSPEELGRRLSAFSLTVDHPVHGRVTLESAFQSAKVFSRGGPYRELAARPPREAKLDARLKASGLLLHFDWCGERFPARPATAFYDWLYMHALSSLDDVTRRAICDRDGFSDIAFNPAKSLNCQAHSAALFVSLAQAGAAQPWLLPYAEFARSAYEAWTNTR